jgi:hypothetical protein
MSYNLHDKLLAANFFPVSMETVFGRTPKERALSLYNDYAFYVSTWSFFKTTSSAVMSNSKELEAPKEFCIKNFVSRYLSSINSHDEDSDSVDIPVLCSQSSVTLPEQIGDSFISDAPIRVSGMNTRDPIPGVPLFDADNTPVQLENVQDLYEPEDEDEEDLEQDEEE